ncbi:hypothetical protein OTK49_01240 [Vibrio coralliirubri]|uniref:hypothetical protein n=1 Tax=Vibrio coralliirubri TaxID=1516159 RepID=UPI002284952D|nr:hypothetical protein [Vibrio coralliirubri]MCY9861154.1 hypothetical protein [Vibrio coralliirubri]
MPNTTDTSSYDNSQNSLNDREAKKVARQVAGTKKYLEFLSSNGGWVDFKQYGQLIGSTEEQVADRVAAFELVSVKVDGEVFIPLYQYDTCRQEEVYGLASFNKVLMGANELGNSYTSSWWLSGSHPNKRARLLDARDNAEAYEHLMVQARLAGEMGR